MNAKSKSAPVQPPPARLKPTATDLNALDPNQYAENYARSIEDPDSFWAAVAERLTWSRRWHTVKQESFTNPVSIKWFEGGELNACYNCVDRHLPKHRDRIAFHFQSEDPREAALAITYGDLFAHVVRLATGLKTLGVRRGDRVTIYLPMIPEAIYAILACARIGAVHNVIFAGFSPEAIADRIRDSASEFVITADGAWRGGKPLPLKANVDRALERVRGVKHVVVVRRGANAIDMMPGRDVEYAVLDDPQMTTLPDCPPEAMPAEAPLFLLYTSGSTSKPKGVLHTTGGYLTYAAFTFATTFAHDSADTYWCAADVGWITGHTYIVYGPLANGATQVLYEGLPTYPTAARPWEIVDQFRVNTLYTAPTLIRALMAEGPAPLERTSRASLKLLGTVGEPINPEAWSWFYREVGRGRCPIVDMWWQTETGGHMITPLPTTKPLKPGAAARPLYGIRPVLVDEKGRRIEGAGEGNLCIEGSWPGQMRSIYGDHQRFFETYFSIYPGLYFTGDGARRDADGDYWITGRVDDVLNVSGHRLGTAEIESALVSHRDVAEAAVVGHPHALKGQGVFAFVTLNVDVIMTPALEAELKEVVRAQIGGLAKPDHVQWARALPKTRSGKIMRRILRKIAAREFEDLGDVTTLADPAVVTALIAERARVAAS